MIVLDPPFEVEGVGLCCHMMSTAAGEAGHLELMSFAMRLGLRPEWVQHRGTHRECFDLIQTAIERAERKGCPVLSIKEYTKKMHAKKATPCKCSVCCDSTQA